MFSVDAVRVAPGSLFMMLEMLRIFEGTRHFLRGRLVDLGCGRVPFYEWYRDRVSSIVCIDWRADNEEVCHADVLADLSRPLPLGSQVADSVLMTSVLEHVEDPWCLMREVHRILAPGGVLVIEVPFLYQLHEEPFDHYRYTKHGLRSLAERSGFEILVLEHYGSAFGVLVDVSSKVGQSVIDACARALPKRLRPGAFRVGYGTLRLYQRLAFWFGGLSAVRKIINENGLGSKFALGHVAVLKALKPPDTGYLCASSAREWATNVGVGR